MEKLHKDTEHTEIFLIYQLSKDIDMLAKVIRKYPVVPVIGNGKSKLQPIYIDDI